MVLSPVAARKAVNFKNKSRSRSGVVITSTDRPPASVGSVEQGFGFVLFWGSLLLFLARPGNVFFPYGEVFLRQRDDILYLSVLCGSGLHALACVCDSIVGSITP